MARHDPELTKAFEANRAAIARARQEAVLALRADGAAERYALAQKMAREAKGGRFDFDAYTSACRAIDADYARREIKSFGLRGRV